MFLLDVRVEKAVKYKMDRIGREGKGQGIGFPNYNKDYHRHCEDDFSGGLHFLNLFPPLRSAKEVGEGT